MGKSQGGRETESCLGLLRAQTGRETLFGRTWGGKTIYRAGNRPPSSPGLPALPQGGKVGSQEPGPSLCHSLPAAT